MKKIFKSVILIFLLCISIFVLTGCQNKGEEESKKVDPIVGSWKYEKANFTYTFNEDGTGNYNMLGTDKPFTYKIEDDQISILYEGDTAPFVSTYKIDGDTLNVIDSFDNDTIYKKVQ